MVGNLGCLAVGDQRADGHQTSVAGCKVRAQPEIAEQNIGGVLHDAGSNGSELLFHGRGTLLLRLFVEWKEAWRSSRKLIGSDVTRGENILHNGCCRGGVPPAGVKREMR